MKLSLVVQTPGKSDGKVIPITQSQFVIGRAPECQLRPASNMISKRHCALLVRAGKAYVQDFDSTNGTFINDQRIKGEVELHSDDNLRLGPLTFKVLIQAGAPARKPASVAPAKKRGAAMDEDSVADLLLSLSDETVADTEADASIGASGTGEAESDPGAETETSETIMPKTGSGPVPVKKPASADTSGAAKAILDKYMRRPNPA